MNVPFIVNPRPIYKGIPFIYGETGTEGNHWAIQKLEFIDSSKEYFWDINGLYILRDRDELIILDKDDKVLYWGEVSLKYDEQFYKENNFHHYNLRCPFEKFKTFFCKENTAYVKKYMPSTQEILSSEQFKVNNDTPGIEFVYEYTNTPS